MLFRRKLQQKLGRKSQIYMYEAMEIKKNIGNEGILVVLF